VIWHYEGQIYNFENWKENSKNGEKRNNKKRNGLKKMAR
jgi:hypothetical protein